MGYSTLRVEPHFRSVRFRTSAPPSVSLNWSRRSVTAVIDLIPVQRSNEMSARVRKRACLSSAAGLRDRYASSHPIDVVCEGCAALVSSANCSPLVQPSYSISFSQFCSSRSN